MIRKSIKFLIGLAAIYAVTLGSAAPASAKSKAPKIKTKIGTVIGVTVGGVNEFLGIPYAEPPVGAMRWEPPTALKKFKKPFKATAFGSECSQSGGGSENCLFLNVYVPKKSKTKKSGAVCRSWSGFMAADWCPRAATPTTPRRWSGRA
jgi:Carboxylesterase family